MNSQLPIVELRKYVKQVSQRNRSDATTEVFSVTNSDGFTKSTDFFKKEVFSKNVSNYKVVTPGQFAYNPSRINVGSIDCLRHCSPVIVSPLYVVFESNTDIHADYLLRYLKSDWGNAQIRANTEGAVRDSLKFKGLENIKIPLPPLDDQIRIAYLLGKVEGLIAQLSRQLEQLDGLLRSIYLDMFGPKSDSCENWPLVEIKDIAAKHKGAMRTGPFGSNLLHSEFSADGDVAVLGIDNAVQNRFAWDKRRFITTEKYRKLKNYRIFPGDVIVTIMGTIGRSAVVPDDIPLAINTKHLAAITVNQELANPLFLSYSIHSSPFILNQFKSKNRGAIMSGLNLGLIKETKLKRPPIELQTRFSEIHIRIDELKAKCENNLIDLRSLFGALSQQAFKGELDLSRVSMPSTRPEEHKAAAAVPFGSQDDQDSDVQLPDTGIPLDALGNSESRAGLIEQWLKSYSSQLGEKPFSTPQFIAAAQARLGELHPEHDIELGSDDYEHIKAWVFESLAVGNLEQVRDITGYKENSDPILGNRVEVKATSA